MLVCLLLSQGTSPVMHASRINCLTLTEEGSARTCPAFSNWPGEDLEKRHAQSLWSFYFRNLQLTSSRAFFVRIIYWQYLFLSLWSFRPFRSSRCDHYRADVVKDKRRSYGMHRCSWLILQFHKVTGVLMFNKLAAKNTSLNANWLNQ